jgi:hypothetical protein
LFRYSDFIITDEFRIGLLHRLRGITWDLTFWQRARENRQTVIICSFAVHACKKIQAEQTWDSVVWQRA